MRRTAILAAICMGLAACASNEAAQPCVTTAAGADFGDASAEHVTTEALSALMSLTVDNDVKLAATSAGAVKAVAPLLKRAAPLEGAIDQVEGGIIFATATSHDALGAFDAQVEQLCATTETLANAIVKKHPQFAKAAA